MRLPLFHVVAAGDTLSSIAASAGASAVSPEEVATQNENILLNAGVTIAAPHRSTVALGTDATLSTIAAATACSIGSLATLAADRIGILTVGKVLTYTGKSEIVQATPGGSESLAAICVRFREQQGVAPTPADLGVANADVVALFVAGTVLETDDYVLQPGDTFASLAAEYPEFTIDALAAAAQDSPNLYAAGISLFLLEKPPLVPTSGDTLASIATTQGIGLDQLTVFNESTPLAGPAIFLPDRVDIVATASPDFLAAPYVLGANDTLSAIATLFDESADAVASRNWELRGVFVPGRNVSAGGVQTQTTAGDSLRSVYLRLAQQSSSLTPATYVAAIAGTTMLLREGALFIEPLPSTGPATTTLQALADTYHSTPALLAQANAALYNFLVPGVAVTAGGATVTTAAGDTFDSLVQTFLLGEAVRTTVGELATLNASAALIAADQHFLIPPNPVVLVHDLELASPAVFPSNPFRLVTELVIRRELACVAPEFRAAGAVRESRSAIAPYSVASAGGGELSLQTFAANFETVLPQLKLATGTGSLTHGGPRAIWVVDFGPGGIESVDIAGQAPSIYGLPPLSTSLRDEPGVPIRTFDPATGTLSETAELRDFKAVDLDVWARTFTAAVDLLLTAEYAAPAHRKNAAALNGIIGDKVTLAQRISEGLTNILVVPSPAGVVADARERLRQELLLSLSAGFATDAVVQYPVTVRSTFGPPFDGATAPRLSGKPTAVVYTTSPGDTIALLAAHYGVSAEWIAELLGPVVRILASGTMVEFSGTEYAILPDDTINTLMLRVGATSYADFVENLAAPDGFFLPHTTINIQEMASPLSAMTAGDLTFDTLVAWFGEPLAVVVANNVDRQGIFIVGKTITYPGSTASVVVTAQNDTL
ncbi:MAG: LysM peptidoglycan-binding domain-containing protein, partial [Thermoanaerobaculia bacterium]